MIAFHIFGWPIYRYGIVYTSGFVIGYIWLSYIGKKINAVVYPGLSTILTHYIDDVILGIMLGVIIGGRLGDVFIYNRDYYSQHLDQIIAIRNGGMSFVGGFIGVALVIFYYMKKFKLTKNEVFLLFDYIVFILPLIIGFGRIANGLNQELYGKIIDLSSGIIQYNYELLYNLKLIRIYDTIDNEWRRNTNILESLCEGFLIFLIFLFRFLKKIISGVLKPGSVTGLFCIMYGIVRIVLESLRDNPGSEYIYGILKSQILMLGFILLGLYIYLYSKEGGDHKIGQ